MIHVPGVIDIATFNGGYLKGFDTGIHQAVIEDGIALEILLG